MLQMLGNILGIMHHFARYSSHAHSCREVNALKIRQAHSIMLRVSLDLLSRRATQAQTISRKRWLYNKGAAPVLV